MRKKLPNIEVLTRLSEVGPDIINQYVRPGPHCVLATTVGQMTLVRFGITAEPYPVEVSICNQAWVDWVADKCEGGREAQLRRGAYLLSNAPDFKGQSFSTQKVEKPWDGHLVLRVRNGSQPPWLLDLDLGSFNRPQHHIHLPGGVLAPLDEGCVSGTFSDGTVSTSVSYRPLVAPYRDDYQTARDWLERARFKEHVDELEAAIRG